MMQYEKQDSVFTVRVFSLLHTTQVCNRFEPLLKTDTFFKRDGQAMHATLINMRADGAATLSARVTRQARA